MTYISLDIRVFMQHFLMFLTFAAAAKRPVGRRGAKKKEEDEEKMEELIFSVEAHSGKELRHFKFLCVSFMAQLLGSTSFIGKVGDVSASVHNSL